MYVHVHTFGVVHCDNSKYLLLLHVEVLKFGNILQPLTLAHLLALYKLKIWSYNISIGYFHHMMWF